MHLPSVVAVASALIALVSATPVNIDSSGKCPILCATQSCCAGHNCQMMGLVYVSITRLDVCLRRMSAWHVNVSTTVSRISTSISIGAHDG
ncbi:uncharacterized protein F5147DRAFT_679553 [Suillus discolor]|uniref:Hydrophobin n=1 Tax=Suillus discolor TaxID=1912936 RepID=A0A9P7FC73_9AGAM|nr:uncharacterized protein F5147DRAFT_679553 [Suillus discolor]KAG2113751.1 hypothetical protein F5147DRAFT_679553 [Suillus discolor]